MRPESEIKDAIKDAVASADLQALHSVENELRGAPAAEYRALLASTLFRVGEIHIKAGRNQSALTCLREALEIAESNHDDKMIALYSSKLASAYSLSGDYVAALHNDLHALNKHTKLKNIEGMALVTANIGKIYEATKDFTKALEHLNQAAELYRQFGTKSDIAFIIGSIGSVHSNRGDHELALDHFQRALQMFKEEDDEQGVALASIFALSILTELSMPEEATALLDELDALDIEDVTLVLEREDSRASVQSLKGDHDGAFDTLKKALELAEESGSKSRIADLHERLREVAKIRSDLEAYIHHNEQHLAVSDEIRGAETQRKLAAETKDREIQHERKQRERERAVLYSTLPRPIADRVIRGESVTGDTYDDASVLFLDIVGFTEISSRIPPSEVIHLLSSIFKVCDSVCHTHGLTKVKTIGDSYMAVAGVPEIQPDHVERAAAAACALLHSLDTLEVQVSPGSENTSWVNDIGEIQVRIGIHCGPVVAGVIGTERLQFDIWGDTVNVASRMESTGEPGGIHVSEDFANKLDASGWKLEQRGSIDIKGKGELLTSWLRGHKVRGI